MSILSFPAFNPEEMPELDEADREELELWLAKVQAAIRALDEKEPRNQNSEAYEAWADRHEELEDIQDEILDCLDELED